MDDPKPLGEFGFKLRPLAPGPAAWAFILLYMVSSLLVAGLPPDAIADMMTYWGAVVFLGLPVILIIFRLLFTVFENVWFAVVVIGTLTVVSATAAVLLPVDAAMAMVFRTYPFAALGASLGLSLLACILKRRWDRDSIPYIALHLGLVIVLAGGFLSLFLRASGMIVLKQGATVSSLDLNDYVLSVTSPDGRTSRIPLPLGPYAPPECNTAAGQLALKVTNLAGPREQAPTISIAGREGADSATAELRYKDPPRPLKVGAKEYKIGLDSTTIRLPFSVTLVNSRTEYYAGGALPKSYTANVTLASSASPAGTIARKISVNSPARRDGYEIFLYALDDKTGVFEIVRDPGAGMLFFGGAVFFAALVWIYGRRSFSVKAASDTQQ
jgi:hypothetical protein